MIDQYQLLFKAEGTPGPMLRQTYGGEKRLDVRDLTTHMTMQICVSEISPYRHMLLLDGKVFRILNVVRQQ